MKKVYSKLAIPPGEYLAEVIADMGLTVVQFADRINWPSGQLKFVVSGTSPLIPEYADTFAKHTDVPAHIWTGLTDEDLKALERMGR